MNTVAHNLLELEKELPPHVKLIAVSKTYPADVVKLAYDAGQRVFGENKVQEMCEKYEQLPKDIEWHLIGHLQTNKVKYIVPFVSLIHSVDSLKLLQEINKQALKNNRVIDCLLQIYIAQEETKFGLSEEECQSLLASDEYKQLKNTRIIGVMGMASNTEDQQQIRREFGALKKLKDQYPQFTEMSCGMSSDYKIAIEEGSTMIRIGSSIFGKRNYT
jgi:hypothetical protein